LILKPPIYHCLSVQLKNYQAELYHIKSYCYGYIASEQQEWFHCSTLWALSTEPPQYCSWRLATSSSLAFLGVLLLDDVLTVNHFSILVERTQDCSIIPFAFILL